jgi:RNA polymerase sigma-70 factor (ECF subfamily)
MNAKDIEALRAFYVENRQQLYTYAVSLTKSREAAEDAIQGVFEKLLRGTALPHDLRPYVFRSVRNGALDGWRRAKVRLDSLFESAVTVDATRPEAPPSSRPDDLDTLLQQLSADERDAIVLKTYSGLTFQQIAEMREVPLPTVASWYRRGLEQLRSLLKEEL